MTQWALLGPLLALLAATGFSAKAIFIKLAYTGAQSDPVTLLAQRMLFSVPFFAGMWWWGSRQASAKPIERRDWLLLIWLGFLGNYLASFLDFTGLQYISAALERLILFTYPAIVLILSVLFLGKRAHGRELLAVVLSFCGIALVFFRDLQHAGTSARSLWVGSFLVFLCSLTYAAFLVGNTGVIRRIGSLRFSGIVTSIAAAFVLLHFALTRPIEMLWPRRELWGLVTGLAVISTAIPNWLTAEAIRRIGSQRVAIIGTIGPILTIGMGGLFLDEPMTVELACGAVLVLAGVTLVSRSH